MNRKIVSQTGLLKEHLIKETLNLLNSSESEIIFAPLFDDVTNTLNFYNNTLLCYKGEKWFYAYDKCNKYFFISSFGRFYSAYKEEICKQRCSKNGHLQISYKYVTGLNNSSIRNDPHTYLYEHIHNKKIPLGFEIHHKDFLLTGHNNNKIENLVCLSKEEHLKIHSENPSNFRYKNIPSKKTEENSLHILCKYIKKCINEGYSLCEIIKYIIKNI